MVGASLQWDSPCREPGERWVGDFQDSYRVTRGGSLNVGEVVAHNGGLVKLAGSHQAARSYN